MLTLRLCGTKPRCIGHTATTRWTRSGYLSSTAPIQISAISIHRELQRGSPLNNIEHPTSNTEHRTALGRRQFDVGCSIFEVGCLSIVRNPAHRHVVPA